METAKTIGDCRDLRRLSRPPEAAETAETPGDFQDHRRLQRLQRPLETVEITGDYRDLRRLQRPPETTAAEPVGDCEDCGRDYTNISLVTNVFETTNIHLIYLVLATPRTNPFHLDYDNGLYDVIQAVSTIHNWFPLGLALGLSYDSLNRIKSDHSRDNYHCLVETLAAWLQKRDMVARRGGPSWRALAQGLDTPLVGKTDVASMIAVDHKTLAE